MLHLSVKQELLIPIALRSMEDKAFMARQITGNILLLVHKCYQFQIQVLGVLPVPITFSRSVCRCRTAALIQKSASRPLSWGSDSR